MVNTNWKRTDSPNVSGACWGYAYNGQFYSHDETNIFESPPVAVVQGDSFRFGMKNKKYAVVHQSAWFKLDGHNDIYDVATSY